ERYGEAGGEQRMDQRGEYRGEQFRQPQSEIDQAHPTPHLPAPPPEWAGEATMTPQEKAEAGDRMMRALSQAPVSQQEPERPSEPEVPRRRSTVREPAPMVSSHGVDAPTANPMVPRPSPNPMAPKESAPANGDEDAKKPRKTGWWAKRLLGGGD